MTLEIALLALRLLAAGLLLAFVVALFLAIRRDMVLASTQVLARRRRHGQLVVIAAHELPHAVGTTFPLLPVTSFGRAPTNTVHLQDDYVSNHHALLTLRAGCWWLEDRGSRNGTTLNGRRLESPTVVSGGDVVGIGETELKVELE